MSVIMTDHDYSNFWNRKSEVGAWVLLCIRGTWAPGPSFHRTSAAAVRDSSSKGEGPLAMRGQSHEHGSY